jgi:signal transduction histidine kinase
MDFYEQAIRSARENGFIHNEAIAYELAARFYAARGLDEIAHLYLRNARYCYARWGADGKVRQLDQSHPQLKHQPPVAGPARTIGAPVEHLDLATVIKVSQAVSSEIVLEKLLDTLMRTAIEQAGAERGLLIVSEENEQRIAAEAITSGDTIIVRLPDQPVTTAALPEALVRTVLRTREPVILDDAAVDPAFAADPYIRQRQGRSILCLPLIDQSNLIGVLYLENNLAARVFAPARISVLKLLASQAAIALENAHLYHDLAERERKIRRQQEYDRLRQRLGSGSIEGLLDLPLMTDPDRRATMDMLTVLTSPALLTDSRSLLLSRRGIAQARSSRESAALIKKVPARKDAVAINDAILEVIALTRTEAANNSVSVRTQLAEGLPRVQGDRVQLQQVLLNLIINAIEAMRDVGEEERELLISTRNEPGGVSVEVRDSGPGFAPAALERVFESFYTTKPSGLGLGLSICRSIIEAHNGRLWASANLPRGASFQFALPAIANTAS